MQREAEFDKLWCMNTTYPSNLSDAEWECLQKHLLSEPDVANRGPMHYERFLMQSFTSCALAARGTICLATSHHGKQCSTVFDVCASKASGFASNFSRGRCLVGLTWLSCASKCFMLCRWGVPLSPVVLVSYCVVMSMLCYRPVQRASRSLSLTRTSHLLPETVASLLAFLLLPPSLQREFRADKLCSLNSGKSPFLDAIQRAVPTTGGKKP
jgi:hypothetical protein